MMLDAFDEIEKRQIKHFSGSRTINILLKTNTTRNSKQDLWKSVILFREKCLKILKSGCMASLELTGKVYKIVKVIKPGAYQLAASSGKPVPRLWNSMNHKC